MPSQDGFSKNRPYSSQKVFLFSIILHLSPYFRLCFFVRTVNSLQIYNAPPEIDNGIRCMLACHNREEGMVRRTTCGEDMMQPSRRRWPWKPSKGRKPLPGFPAKLGFMLIRSVISESSFSKNFPVSFRTDGGRRIGTEKNSCLNFTSRSASSRWNWNG